MSGSAVPFSQTLSNLRVPLASFEIGSGNSASSQTQRSLLIGFSASALPLVPILVTSLSQAQGIVGAQSMLGRMVLAYLNNDPDAELWMLPVSPNSGDVDNKTNLTITGSATGAGTIAIYVGGQRLAVSVAPGDTALVIAQEFQAAMLSGAVLPVQTSGSAGGTATAATVAMTATKLSYYGNDLSYNVNYRGAAAGEVLPPGIAVGFTSVTTGAGTATLTGAANALGSKTYDFIGTAFRDSVALGVLQTMLSDVGGRWSPSQMEYGHVWTALHAPAVVLAAAVSAGDAENDRHTTYLASPSPTTPWEHMSATMGACAASIRNDPNRPLQGLQVIGPLAPLTQDAYSRANQQLLLTNGCALTRWDHGGNCYVERMVTTYTTDANGNADQSYLDTETLYTLMYFVRTMKSAVETKFARVKLVDNGTHLGQGVAAVTPNDIRNEIVSQYSLMELVAIVEDTDSFAAGLVVTRNTLDPSRCDVLLDPYLVSGLRILANLVNFYLNSPVATTAVA